MKQIHGAVQALQSDRILAAILDFVEIEKRKKKLDSTGPISILQIFGKNPSRVFEWEQKQNAAAGGLCKKQ